jgi:hypothetical protein
MVVKARKINARVLKYCGMMAIFVGLIWIGTTVDLLLLIFSIGHIPFEYAYLYCIMEYMWAFPAFVFSMAIGAELMAPEKKKLIIILSVILGIIFEIFLFLDAPNGFTSHPYVEGELYSSSFKLLHPIFFCIGIFIGTILVFLVFGSLRMGIKSTGRIRRKAYQLALGFFLFIMVVVLDSFGDYFIPWPINIILPDVMMIFVAFLIYFALRPIK